MTIQVSSIPTALLEQVDTILAEVLALRRALQQMTAPAAQPNAKVPDAWQLLRTRLVAEQPELLYMPDEDLRQEFDRLSAQIAEQMPYTSPEELERVMRGDDYGLARY
jgi:hypothetical protein